MTCKCPPSWCYYRKDCRKTEARVARAKKRRVAVRAHAAEASELLAEPRTRHQRTKKSAPMIERSENARR